MADQGISKRWWRIRWEWFGLGLPAIALIIAGFVIAFQFVKPAPPDEITLAAGQRGGAYYSLAEAFRVRMAREGITVHVLETAGTVENLERLTAGEGHQRADAALVQSGVATVEDFPALLSLGSLYLEPLWIFMRDAPDVDDPTALRGRRIFLGAKGSGARALALRLFESVGLEADAYDDVGLPDAASAATAMERGEIDVLATVGAPHAAVVKRLVAMPDVSILNWRRADAITRNYPFLSAVHMPEGTLDLVHNRPDGDIHLVAASANLVVHEDLHPALHQLFVLIAQDLRLETALVAPGEAFPAATHLAFPLSEEAERVYRRGPSFLMRVLPFWAANLIDRFLVMLLPLLTLALPLMRVFPPVYRWRVRSRIYRWYRELVLIEQKSRNGSVADADALRRELAEIENEVSQVSVPLSYADELYNLRIHIRYLRETLTDPQKERPLASGAPATGQGNT